MTGGDGRDHLVAAAVADPASPAGGVARPGPPAVGDASRRRSTTTSAGSTSATGGSSYYYSRTAMAATRLDHRRRRGPDRRHRRGLVRPPVGRLHHGRRRRLGLVRGQPRRRDGPDAVARPGRRRVVPAGLRHARRRPTARRTHLPREAFRVDGDGALDEPGDRRRLSGRLADLDPGRGPVDRPHADRRRPGARHAGDDRGRVLGGIAARGRDARRAAARRRGLRGADRLRAGGTRGADGARRVSIASPPGASAP